MFKWRVSSNHSRILLLIVVAENLRITAYLVTLREGF